MTHVMTHGRTTRWATALAAAVQAAVIAAAVCGVARPAAAQPKLPRPPVVKELGPSPGQRKPDRKPGKDDDVPVASRPPAGMCRIWLDNVPPAQQPAPTDCASAVRNRPPNARVLFGDDYVRKPDGADAAAVAAAPPGSYAVHEPAAERAHGPNAGGDAPWFTPAPADPDSTGRRNAAVSRPLPRPAASPASSPAAPASADDWEAGYAAGYRDAMQGRRPRVRGVDRAADRAGDRPTGRPDTRTGSAADVDDDERDPAPAAGVYPGSYPSAYPGVVTGRGTAVVIPPGADPRYFNNGRTPPPGRANGVCLDRDLDGWCDDPRFGAPVCRDLDGDGRCDDVPALAAAPYPAALPDMRAGLDVQRGRGSEVALRWLGTTEVVARASDLRGTGAPSRVTWLDANTGALLQVWSDRDGDGVADRVEVYRNGRRVKLLGR